MRQAVIVIGCSYGDEGKGLATVFSAQRLGGNCLNVLINGGPQRGHTVDLPDGRRHVFHHFGSAALAGATSLADEDFLVNPLMYVQEYQELTEAFGISPMLLAADTCRVTLPWDMMLSQIIEENRGASRHGSCGCGIFETRHRFQCTDWALRYGQLAEISEADYIRYCRRMIEEYVPHRLESLNMSADEAWIPVLRDEGIIRRSWEDLVDMRGRVQRFHSWTEAAAPFDRLIFEAGQGLALDEENLQDFPHLTPSRTTSLVSARRIAALDGPTDTQVLYVTRSYLTRHGAGPFPTECAMETIRPGMVDRTNMPNPHQQTLRYGRFDAQRVLERVSRDRNATRAVVRDASFAVMITHLNETDGQLACSMSLQDFSRSFDSVYLSDCPWQAHSVQTCEAPS